MLSLYFNVPIFGLETESNRIRQDENVSDKMKGEAQLKNLYMYVNGLLNRSYNCLTTREKPNFSGVVCGGQNLRRTHPPF